MKQVDLGAASGGEEVEMAVIIDQPFCVELPVLGKFTVSVVGIPPDLPSRDIHRDQYDDRTFHVCHTMGTIWFKVYNVEDGKFVGHAEFGSDSVAVRCDTVTIEASFRRNGVASALYELASYIFNAPVVKSNILSQDAVDFWSGRTEIFCSNIDQLEHFSINRGHIRMN